MTKNQSSTSPQSLSKELQFLITCCKTNPSEKDIKFICSYLLNATRLTLNTLIALANQHGILPLVYKTIKKLSLNNSSSSSRNTSYIARSTLLSELKSLYMAIAQRNMLMTSELIKIMDLLRENDIEALAFKGPSLSQMAYGDITLRQYSDLDILVDEADAYKAGKLMSENTHTALLPLKILKNNTCLHTAKDFSLMSKGGVHTELHWRLFEKKYNISLLSCASEQKCQTVSINGNTVKTLQNELLLVYLCLHGAKHAFGRIEWICDIDRLIRSSDVNWDDAIALAEQSHSKRSFYLGLSLAHSLLRTPVPDTLAASMQTEDIQMLQEMTLKKISEEKNERSNFKKNRETFAYQARLFDSRSDMIRFRLSTFFKISTNDCQTFTLPENLNFLYIFLRPLRLAWSYGKKVFNET